MRKNMEIESSCTKVELMIEILTDESLTIGLRETELEDPDESHQYSIVGQLGLSGFHCK